VKGIVDCFELVVESAFFSVSVVMISSLVSNQISSVSLQKKSTTSIKFLKPYKSS